MADIAKILLLTVQRKGSVEAMRRDQIDFARNVWAIPSEGMKSAKPHLVPLSRTAIERLESLPPLVGPYLFGVGSEGAKPFAGASNGVPALRRQIGAFDWRLHDIRRTVVTLAQRGGAGIEEIRALTQHKTPGVIGVYARHAYADEKRRVVEIIERELLAVLDVGR